ncbi:hypothetical protein DLJ50_20690, partial [Shigella sonnei]
DKAVHAASGSRAPCLMRRFARLIRPTVYGRSVGRIRRSRRIRQSCTIINAYSVYWRGRQYARQ